MLIRLFSAAQIVRIDYDTDFDTLTLCIHDPETGEDHEGKGSTFEFALKAAFVKSKDDRISREPIKIKPIEIDPIEIEPIPEPIIVEPIL